jgi:hypothetical protein
MEEWAEHRVMSYSAGAVDAKAPRALEARAGQVEREEAAEFASALKLLKKTQQQHDNGIATSEQETSELNPANGNDIAASEQEPSELNSANGNDITASEQEPSESNSANGNDITASDQEFDHGDAFWGEWEGDIGGESGGNLTPAETARQTRKRKRVSPADAKKPARFTTGRPTCGLGRSCTSPARGR